MESLATVQTNIFLGLRVIEMKKPSPWQQKCHILTKEKIITTQYCKYKGIGSREHKGPSGAQAERFRKAFLEEVKPQLSFFLFFLSISDSIFLNDL